MVPDLRPVFQSQFRGQGQGSGVRVRGQGSGSGAGVGLEQIPDRGKGVYLPLPNSGGCSAFWLLTSELVGNCVITLARADAQTRMLGDLNRNTPKSAVSFLFRSVIRQRILGL